MVSRFHLENLDAEVIGEFGNFQGGWEDLEEKSDNYR